MLTIAQKLIKWFPREDRPYLNRLVVRAGVLLATNAHVTVMLSSDLSDGDYDIDLNPLPIYADYPLEKLFDYFSNISDMMEIPIGKVVKVWDKKYQGMGVVKHVKVGDVFVSNPYWNLIEPQIKTLRSGPLRGVSHAIAGEHSEGLFIIAGITPDDK